MGVEPTLSMMYFYGEAYIKALSLQALATELYPQVASPLRGCKVIKLKIMIDNKRTLTGLNEYNYTMFL